MAKDKVKEKAAKKVEKAVRKAMKKGVAEGAIENDVSQGIRKWREEACRQSSGGCAKSESCLRASKSETAELDVQLL
jgi:hypothetical protein